MAQKRAASQLKLGLIRHHPCMPKLIELQSSDARAHLLKGSSYFNGDFPKYISFKPILDEVAALLAGGNYTGFKKSNPNCLPKVNYSFTTNKDGRLAWRPLELIHPVLYVSLVNAITESTSWSALQTRLAEFEGGVVSCCSAPVVSEDHQKDVATQVKSWWQTVEQRSLALSLEYTHLLHTDVTDCYGALYTHSISWAVHGLPKAKSRIKAESRVGNLIDEHIRAGRYGQTNGISQGSVLMDFIAEMVLGYVDSLINADLVNTNDVRVLRYRDDYRIFSNTSERGEEVLKIISDKLRSVGMRLGVTKTISCRNVVEGSVKPEKLAGIELQDLGTTNAKTIQKQLLRLHAFGRRYPNSGALKRLVSEFHVSVSKQTDCPEDLDVQVAIATDISFGSPSTFPAIAGILSHLISLAPDSQKPALWSQVRKKMQGIPYNGYLEVWLQRVTIPKAIALQFYSNEALCQIVAGNTPVLWDSSWLSCVALKNALDVGKIVVSDPSSVNESIQPEEVQLFKENASHY
jgi:RNA-directed DNA polymerase